jgi:hypothetical protein
MKTNPFTLHHRVKSKETIKTQFFVLTGKAANFSWPQPESQPAAATVTGIIKFKSEAEATATEARPLSTNRLGTVLQ